MKKFNSLLHAVKKFKPLLRPICWVVGHHAYLTMDGFNSHVDCDRCEKVIVKR